MTMPEDQYFEQAGQWGEDRYHSAQAWIKRLTVLVVVLLVITILAVGAVFGLTPLKEKVPFLVTKDSATGEISVPQQIDPDEFTSQWLVDQAFIWKYLKARERFVDLDTEEQDHIMVQILSDNAARDEFLAYYEAAPDSKPKLFKTGDRRSLHVKAIIKLEDGLVQIHWSATDYQKGKIQPAKHYISTLHYSYSATAVPSDPKNKLENLVGFQVTSYQREFATLTE